MASTIGYTCGSCGRPGQTTWPALTRLLARNRAVCQYCGEGLVFPADVQARIDAAKQERAAQERPVSYDCGSCGRVFEAPLARAVAQAGGRCQLCGGALRFPPEVQAAAEARRRTGVAERFQVPCPTCARTTWASGADPEERLGCDYCGARFRPPVRRGAAGRPPRLDVPPAPAEDVQGIVEGLPRRPPGPLVAAALRARAARGEVTHAEAIVTVARIAALLAWDPEVEPDRLPLPVDEAAALLPPLLFPGQPYHRDPTPRDGGAELDLVFLLEQRSGILDANLAINVLSLASVAVGGAGIFGLVSDDQNPDEHRLRVRLTSDGDGARLSLGTQKNEGRVAPAPAKLRTSLTQQLAARRPDLLSCYALQAVYGPWVQGTPAVHAQRAAIQRRLEELGGSLAEEAGDLAAELTISRG